VVGSTEFVLPIPLAEPVLVSAFGAAFGPVPWSVGDADGLPEPESDGDGDGETEGDGGGDELDDGDDAGDVGDWDDGTELAGVLGAADCDGDPDGLAVGDGLGVGQFSEEAVTW
jgi:hypothetical protein